MKKIRLSITAKLVTAFGFLSAIIIFSGIYLFYITNEYKGSIENTRHIYLPTINLLDDINSYVLESNELLLIWVYVEKDRNTKCKNKLDNIANYQIPILIDKLNSKKEIIPDSLKNDVTILQKEILDFLNTQREIMLNLETTQDYKDEKKMLWIKSNFGSENQLKRLSDDIYKRNKNLRKNVKLILLKEQKALLDLYKETKSLLFIRLICI